jgi:Glycosyl hydrolases family 39
MMQYGNRKSALIFALALVTANSLLGQSHKQKNQSAPVRVVVGWDNILRVSNTNATLQAVVTPLMSPASPLHPEVWTALADLHANYVRYVPWLPYPRLAVAELEPPTEEATSWDFSKIDPYTEAFFRANPQLPVIMNFSTIPQWMFKTPQPVKYPDDANEVTWDYTQGTELRDPTMKELSEYYARLVSWYTQGEFTDELGKRHLSGHHFNFDYWEVFNEIDLEHSMTPRQYTERYDSVTAAIQKIKPQMKFVGLALARPSMLPDYFEYFLNSANHKPGAPLDMISYHFYAAPTPDQPVDNWQYTVFEQSANFVGVAKYIDSIRRRLSPSTRVSIDEVGVIAPGDLLQGKPGYVFKPFPDFYWNLCAAQYGYLYGELAKLGIDAVGESALMQPPGFFPSVSMIDWTTGKPNARYWSLKLIRDNFGPGDKIVSASGSPNVYVFGVVTTAAKKRLLLVNMRNEATDVSVPGAAGSQQEYVDQSTSNNPPASSRLTTNTVRLQGFAVSVITLQ